MAKKTVMETTTEKVSALFDLYPIELDEPTKTTMGMREGLAQMYADPSMRAFLENAVRYATRSLVRSSTPESMIFYKSRIETLLQLLNMGKQHFVHFEMLRASSKKNSSEPLREVEHLIKGIEL